MIQFLTTFDYVTLTFFTTFIIFLLYRKFTRNHDYWKKRGIGGPKPLPLLGNFLDFQNSLLTLDMDRFRKYGRIYGFYDGTTPILSVSEPILLKKIMVKDFQCFQDRYPHAHNALRILGKSVFFLPGEQWKRVRSLVTPTFTTYRLKTGLHLTHKCVEGVLGNLNEAAAAGREVDVKRLFGAYTLDVIAKAAFGTDIDTHTNPNNDFARNIEAFFNISYWRILVTLLFPKLAYHFGIFFTHPSSVNFFEGVVLKIIKERRANPGHYNDLLQHLMDAEIDENNPPNLERQGSEDSNPLDEEQNKTETVKSNGGGMTSIKASDTKLTEDEVFAQAFIFLLAGYETTASLLTYSTYSMATHPEIQERLHQEVSEAFADGAEITYDELQKLHYVDAVFSETLRLYSPLFRLDRCAVQDFYCEETGVKIQRGTRISIPVHAVHRDPEFYPDPEKFDPSRFLPENKKNLVPSTWLPFGQGPRNCVGMRFALLEAKLAFAEMIQKFRFTKVENTDVPLQMPKFTAVFQAKRVILGVQRR